jgi:4-amino-4-deoxy-L-arabinose transferase-like glycosyltransferase
MDPGDARRLGVPTLALLATITAVAALLRFWALGRQGFWYDEATTAWLLRGTPGQLLAQLPHTESTPPLYYLLAWGWVRLFGDHEAGLRSLSALAGVATVPVAFAAARTLAGRRVALFAAVLVAVNPFLVWYSQEARSYALLVLAATVALWLFARARAQPSRGRLIAWAAVAAVAICIHYFALFVVLPEGLLLLADRRSAPRWKVEALAVVSIPAIALLVLANAQRGRTYYFVRSPLLTRVEQIPQFFVVGFTPPAGAVALAIGGLAVLAAIALLAGRKDPRARRGALLAGAVGLSAVLVPVLLAVAGADYLNARNVIGAVVPLTIAMACGLATRRRQALGLGAAAVLVAVSVAMVVKVPSDPGAQRTHWQQVAQVLRYTGKPRAILLLGAHTWSRILGFYLPHTWWDPPHGFGVAEIDVLRRAARLGPCPAVVWWGASCNSAPRAPLRRPPARGFRLASDVRVAGFAIDRYLSPRPVRLYSRQPLERYTSMDGAGVREPRSRLMVMPRRSPVVP